MGHQAPWSRGEAAPIASSHHRCCVAHDCCYKRLERRGCGTKLLGYKFAFSRGQVICGKTESYISTQASLFVLLSPLCQALCWAPELEIQRHCVPASSSS